MKEEESSDLSDRTLGLIGWISLSFSLIVSILAIELIRPDIFLIMIPFFVYLLIAFYRIVYHFRLGRSCGFNAAVVSNFFIGLVYWLSIDANVFNSGGLPMLFPIIVPFILLLFVFVIIDLTEDGKGLKHFVQGLFLAAPISLFAITISLALAEGFIEGNFDNWS